MRLKESNSRADYISFEPLTFKMKLYLGYAELFNLQKELWRVAIIWDTVLIILANTERIRILSITRVKLDHSIP